MRKCLALFLLLSLPAYGGDLKNVVDRESLFLSSCSFSSTSCDTLLNIPWDKPSFQFWLSYYRNRWNRVKLLSQVNSFKLFYPIVKEIFRREGLPEDLSLLAIVESNGNPAAVSKAGAAGLWQLMPGTARKLGLKVNWLIDERFDLVKSTLAAAKYLKELHSLFHRWDLAIAAYNAGPGTIKKRLERLGTDQFWDLTKLPDETLEYVPKFYAVLSVVKSSDVLNRPSKEKLVTVKVASRTTLSRVARALNVPYSVVRRFNRQFRRGIVPAGCYVYLPSRSIRNFKILKYAKNSKVYVYVPKRREKLTVIARRFGVSANFIKRLNSLRYNVAFKGQPLVIVKLGEKREDGNS